MSSVFHGGNTYIFYNTDAGNTVPTAVTYKNIDNLGQFPQVKINSSTTSIETYDDEWTQILQGNMTIDSVSIVVHYVPDNPSHQYLDAAFTNQTNFQIKVSLYEAQDSLEQHYVILSGYVSTSQDSSDQNEVFDRTYTFTAEDLIARGTATDPADLRVGDYGVGADGETTPQNESSTPSGNSFIKVPALQDGNPLGVDMGGIAYVDNGGDTGAQFVISDSGTINIYAKNSDNDWKQVLTKDQVQAQTDAEYVPLTRTVNGKPLSADISLSSTDTGSLALTGGTLTGALQAPSLTLTTALPITSGGTGNTTGLAASATKLATARTVRTNLASTTAVNFDGTAAITPGVTGTLPIANGGTGNTTGLAASATKLATARTVLVNLASTSTGSFDGTANITPGISGLLPITNGGTGASTAAAALAALGAAENGANSDITSLTGLTTALSIDQGGTGNTTGLAASATKLATTRSIRTNLASTTAVNFDGTAAITPGVTGTLPIANGGTGNTTGLAATATALATARTISVNLSSTASSSFNGTANITPGVSGILPVANGGTGLASPFGTAAGTFAQGNDSRFNTIEGKATGNMLGNFLQMTGSSATDGSGWAGFQVNNNYNGSGYFNVATDGASRGGLEVRNPHYNYGYTTALTYSPANNNTADHRTTGLAINGGDSTITAIANITVTSDERLKTDIAVIPNAATKLSKIDGVSYVKNSMNELGVIAQKVILEFPEAVIKIPVDPYSEDQTEYYGVNYSMLIGPVIAALNEHTKTIADLQTQITALKGNSTETSSDTSATE